MDSSKKCFKCEAVKPLSEFYRHKMMADGHLNKCKECTKADVGRHRLENLDGIRAYDRRRAGRPSRAKKAAEISARWRAADPRHQRCHSAVSHALRNGSLLKTPCVRCGSQRSVGHHESYDRPLDVTWLCQPCHKARHKEMNIAGIIP